MATRRILFLDGTRLSAYRWTPGHVHPEAEFAHDEGGHEAFGDYLRSHAGSLFYLLADVAEEGFQIEALPYVTGRDRSAILKRKLGQYYYGTPLSAAFSLGRLKAGRRDERMLFAGLTRPQLFEPWLAVLAATEVALAGVYTLPLIAAGLLPELGDAQSRFLLITLTDGGLRQTFFDEGQFRFSRLTPMATGSIDEIAVTCGVEAAKMYQYLAGQRLVARGTPLPVKVLAHPAQTNAFRNRCHDSDALRFDYADLLAVAGKRGLKQTFADSRADALFVHLLIRNTPREQFVGEAARHFYRIWQTRAALVAAGVVVCAGCLLFAAERFADTLKRSEETAQLQTAKDNDERRYQDALRALPPVPLTTDNLRALTGRYEELLKRSPGIEPALLRLSAALKDHAYVELERLDWSIANRADDAPSAKGAGVGTGPSGDAYTVVDVHGILPLSMAGDPRAQQEAIDRFAERLRKDAGATVRILSRPFDAESGKSIKSSGGSATLEAPRFSLRLGQKL